MHPPQPSLKTKRRITGWTKIKQDIQDEEK